MEKKFDVKVLDDVRLMYRELGGWYGDLKGGLRVEFPSPKELTQSFTDEPPVYGKLRSMGLHEMINFNWGNRSDIQVENGFPQASIDVLNRYPCFGWFGDGYHEAHAYIIETSENRYCLYGWHQDYSLTAPTKENEMGLFELVLKVMDANDRLSVADENGDDDRWHPSMC